MSIVLLKRSFSRRSAALCSLALGLLLLPSCDKIKQLLPKQPERQAQVTEEPKGVENPDFGPEKAPEPDVPKAEAFELNKSSIVSILLYHRFVERIPSNEMMVGVSTFRAQMQALKDANIPVIPMADVLAWKKGGKNIPDESVVITFDDGWLSQHELAYPILKEFGYPFTIYLYKKYINIGGKSMKIEQIKEMLANGAELGSHTISHQPLTKKGGKTDEQYQAWLKEEIADSKKWLEETFGVPCRTFAFPYGAKNDDIVKLAMASGYDAAVTVNPQKVTWDTADGKLGRFTQQWDKDTNFKLATSFHGRNDAVSSKLVKTDAVDEQGKRLFALKPEPNSTITERRPLIEAGLSQVGAIVPESVMLRVSGFGAVAAEYDPAKEVVRYKVPQALRLDDCTATLSFKRADSDKEEIVSWKFKIDQKAAYLPVESVEKPALDAKPAVPSAPPAKPRPEIKTAAAK